VQALGNDSGGKERGLLNRVVGEVERDRERLRIEMEKKKEKERKH